MSTVGSKRKSLPGQLLALFAEGSFLGTMVRFDLYKPSQGMLARRLTAAALGVVLGAGVLVALEIDLNFQTDLESLGWAIGLGLIIAWFVFRLVNYPKFASFLIDTQAEMNKVSWTTWNDLKRSTVVVLICVVLISFSLTVIDLVWSRLLKFIGVLQV